MTEHMLEAAKLHNEVGTHVPLGLCGFTNWMARHYGGLFVGYAQNMPTPHTYYVDEEAHASGRVQWSLQGLNTLAKEFIHFPMDDDYM